MSDINRCQYPPSEMAPPHPSPPHPLVKLSENSQLVRVLTMLICTKRRQHVKDSGVGELRG